MVFVAVQSVFLVVRSTTIAFLQTITTCGQSILWDASIRCPLPSSQRTARSVRCARIRSHVLVYPARWFCWHHRRLLTAACDCVCRALCDCGRNEIISCRVFVEFNRLTVPFPAASWQLANSLLSSDPVCCTILARSRAEWRYQIKLCTGSCGVKVVRGCTMTCYFSTYSATSRMSFCTVTESTTKIMPLALRLYNSKHLSRTR